MNLQQATRRESTSRTFSSGTIGEATIEPITDANSKWFVDVSSTDGVRHRAIISEILLSVGGRPRPFDPGSNTVVDTGQYQEYKLDGDTLRLR